MTNITVIGSPAEIALVQKALDKAKPKCDIDAELQHPYRVEFHTTAEFKAKGYVFPSGRPNWGRVVSNRVLWINGTIAARKPYRGQYTVIHELGHAIDSDWNDQPKHKELMALMPSVKPTQGWAQGSYFNKPREIYADAFAEACGIGSPLDSDYGDIADANLPKLLEITFRPNVTPPPPDVEPPDPLPLPDPDVAVLQAQVEALKGQIAAAQEALA